VQIMLRRPLAKELAVILPHIGSHHSRVHHALAEYIEWKRAGDTRAAGAPRPAKATTNGSTRRRRAG